MMQKKNMLWIIYNYEIPSYGIMILESQYTHLGYTHTSRLRLFCHLESVSDQFQDQNDQDKSYADITFIQPITTLKLFY